MIIAYSKNSNAFEIIGTQSMYGSTEYLATPEPSALPTSNGDKYPNNFWSQGLGGAVIVYSDSQGQVVGSDAYSYKEENVTGSLTSDLKHRQLEPAHRSARCQRPICELRSAALYQVNPHPGQSPDANGFWKANFALKDGALIGDANQFKVKALDMELAMKQKELSECGTLATATPELPTISAFKSPNNGDAPALTGAPSVVEGVVKVSK